jgi:hypothetical protein
MLVGHFMKELVAFEAFYPLLFGNNAIDQIQEPNLFSIF